MANKPSKGTASVPPAIRFHYIKGNYFRVVHVDGIIGGWTAPGLLHIATYSERPAIPQVTEHELREPTLGPAQNVEGKAGFVRELDVDLMLSKERVVEIRDWLTERLNELEQLQKVRK
jgi:hypothetical protein